MFSDSFCNLRYEEHNYELQSLNHLINTAWYGAFAEYLSAYRQVFLDLTHMSEQPQSKHLNDNTSLGFANHGAADNSVDYFKKFGEGGELLSGGILQSDKCSIPYVPNIWYTNESETAFELGNIPPLNVMILLVGSRGDVQPFIALAQGLRKQGHRVRFGTHALFEDFVTQFGFEFVSIGGDPKELLAFVVRHPTMITLRMAEVQQQIGIMEEVYIYIYIYTHLVELFVRNVNSFIFPIHI